MIKKFVKNNYARKKLTKKLLKINLALKYVSGIIGTILNSTTGIDLSGITRTIIFRATESACYLSIKIYLKNTTIA
jgi:hypothetical protein